MAFNSLDMTYGQVLEHFTLVLQEEFESIHAYQTISNAISHGNEEEAMVAAKKLVSMGKEVMESVLSEIDLAQEEELAHATGRS